jgi:phage terminase large subunit GpA-like protein
MAFESLESMAVIAFDAMHSSEHLTVVQAAEKYVIIRQPGAHVGPWSAEKTPYLIEPQEVLTSLDYTGMVFVGPARTGKSQMFLNWQAHTVKCDPTDMMLVHMAQHTAREWSKDDLEKMHKNSPEIAAQLRPGRQNDNTFDKEYLSGMRLSITWPTANNLSGKTKRYVWIMDYDRMDDSVDKEGGVFDLAKKRTATFKRFGMTVAESSPGREVDNPKWLAKSPHEAPPTKGILELYNRGDRRRWQWQCLQCHEAFEPNFSLLQYPDSDDMMEAAEQVCLPCPSCGFPMEPGMKDELNMGGRWVKDGMIWLPKAEIVPRTDMKVRRSDIASFWMKGPAAAFQDWSSLVLENLRAVTSYEATGDEEALRKTVTTDQGEPYTPKARVSERTPEDLKAKGEDWGSTAECPTVPEGVRILIATIDVQARSFVVQVDGLTATDDLVLIDGFKIRKSARLDGDGHPLPIDPAGYTEDWDLLVEQVIERTYDLGDGSGRRMQIRLTGCDSGGREGVTFNAYAFWRRLKLAPEGHHRRFALIKGDGSKTAPRAMVTWPDSNRRDKLAAARGDVPVVRLQADLLKDQVAAMLSRRVTESAEASGGGMIRFPAWTEDWYYSQMTTEIRTAKGWENPAKKRNEAFDLTYYALGLAVRPLDMTCPLVTINIGRIDWANPPAWAAEWDDNDMVLWPPSSTGPARPTAKPRTSFADLASKLA